MLTSPVGIRLREERERLGLTQADAADKGGVTREQWGRYERGQMPNSEVLMRMQAHGMDVNYVLGGERMATENTLSDEERELLGFYRCTDHEGQVNVLRQAGMEAARSSVQRENPFAPRPPSQPLSLHEMKVPARKARS